MRRRLTLPAWTRLLAAGAPPPARAEYGVFLINRATSETNARIRLAGSADIASVDGETVFEDGKNDNPIAKSRTTPPVDNDVAISPVDVVDLLCQGSAGRAPDHSARLATRQ
ncbi:MAG: hypothetical protein NTW86_29110 [Candidatus Sumerlaeota bacterium]|nr:hypothetical protein [Candidatus Sumerlaeota bacterium]